MTSVTQGDTGSDPTLLLLLLRTLHAYEPGIFSLTSPQSLSFLFLLRMGSSWVKG